MKKTAVEWLVEQLPLIQQEGLRDVFEQAKKMEKKQMELSDKVIYEMADGLFHPLQDDIYKHGFKHGMVLYRQLLKEKK
jgi:hypothetical protein